MWKVQFDPVGMPNISLKSRRLLTGINRMELTLTLPNHSQTHTCSTCSFAILGTATKDSIENSTSNDIKMMYTSIKSTSWRNVCFADSSSIPVMNYSVTTITHTNRHVSLSSKNQLSSVSLSLTDTTLIKKKKIFLQLKKS